MPLPLKKNEIGPVKTGLDGGFLGLEDVDIGERIAAHAERLWREAGQRGGPADYRAQARQIIAEEEIPH